MSVRPLRARFILPALTEATSPYWRPIKYSLFPPLGLATLAAYLSPGDDAVLEDEHVAPLTFNDRPAFLIVPKGDAPAKEARKDAAPDSPPRKSVADAEKAVVAPAGKPPKYDTQVGTDASAAPAEPAGAPAAAAPPPAAPPSASSSSAAPQPPANEPKAETSKASAKAEPTPKAEPPAKADPKAADAAAKAADAAATAAKNGVKDGFAVQLAAFSDDKGANSLANRLKRSGYPAYTEPLKTSRGTLWRVRVGPFPSREAANTVRDKLKIEGQNGIVAPTH